MTYGIRYPVTVWVIRAHILCSCALATARSAYTTRHFLCVHMIGNTHLFWFSNHHQCRVALKRFRCVLQNCYTAWLDVEQYAKEWIDTPGASLRKFYQKVWWSDQFSQSLALAEGAAWSSSTCMKRNKNFLTVSNLWIFFFFFLKHFY